MEHNQQMFLQPYIKTVNKYDGGTSNILRCGIVCPQYILHPYPQPVGTMKKAVWLWVAVLIFPVTSRMHISKILDPDGLVCVKFHRDTEVTSPSILFPISSYGLLVRQVFCFRPSSEVVNNRRCVLPCLLKIADRQYQLVSTDLWYIIWVLQFLLLFARFTPSAFGTMTRPEFNRLL